MKPALAICPSRERPKRFRTMLESFVATSKNVELIAVVDEDDPTIEEYRTLHDEMPDFELWINQKSNNTERINTVFECLPDYEFYHITNDDVIYRTDEWDVQFINILRTRPGIAFGNDLLFREDLCPTPFVTGDIVRALGWLQMPELTHLYGDNVWMILGKILKSIFYMEGIVIEHMHPIAGKAETDEVYKRTNSDEMYKADEQAFFKWCASQALKDAKRVGEYMNKEKVAKELHRKKWLNIGMS